jgi:hypothetical protein
MVTQNGQRKTVPPFYPPPPSKTRAISFALASDGHTKSRRSPGAWRRGRRRAPGAATSPVPTRCGGGRRCWPPGPATQVNPMWSRLSRVEPRPNALTAPLSSPGRSRRGTLAEVRCRHRARCGGGKYAGFGRWFADGPVAEPPAPPLFAAQAVSLASRNSFTPPTRRGTGRDPAPSWGHCASNCGRCTIRRTRPSAAGWPISGGFAIARWEAGRRAVYEAAETPLAAVVSIRGDHDGGRRCAISD